MIGQAMNREWIRDCWIPALRSGVYKQGKGLLRSHNETYCCLGVAVDLLIHEEVVGEWQPGVTGYQSDGTHLHLPSAACEFIGVHKSGPFFFRNDQDDLVCDHAGGVPDTFDLTHANDVYDYDFETIARLLEVAIGE